ncbi:hypothetical protein [Acidovorax sp.]|jgi:hypothetical protein|uniref:Btc22 family type III secretion system chaperone n=1 Tax=Acidovorax sp. TaxID=1872122 RepID=UPI00391F78C9
MPGQDDHNDIVARAQALVDEVQSQLAAGDEFYRSQGLDPEKVRSVLRSQSTADTEAEARKAFEADMAAVEQEVGEEQARQSFSGAAPAGGAKRPRTMI